MDGSLFALSLQHLREHNPQPAGYAMRECMAASATDAIATATHPSRARMMERAADLFVRNPALLHPDLAWHTNEHGWCVKGSHPWSLNDEDLQQLEWQEMAGDERVFSAVLPSDAGLHQWIATQLQSPVGENNGICLDHVKVVKSATTIAGFHYRVQQTAARLSSGGDNNPFVQSWPDDDVKTAMLRHFESQFAVTERDTVRVLPLWHGCSASVADEIMSKGPAALAKSDDGLFGAGVYLTPQPEYAAVYSSELFSPQPSPAAAAGNAVLLLCAVCVGSAYPVTRAADMEVFGGVMQCKYRNRALHPGCDTHHVLVDARMGFSLPPVDSPLEHHFEEVVVAQEAQVLPIAKVTVRVDRQQLQQSISSQH